jgi:hypothetical protein
MDEALLYRIERKINFVADLLIGLMGIVVLFAAFKYGPVFFRTAVGTAIVLIGWLVLTGLARREYSRL